MYACQEPEGGENVLIQVGKFWHSAKMYCRQGESNVLPTAPDEYRRRHASSGSLKFPWIPHA
jgi:hypothetical protein